MKLAIITGITGKLGEEYLSYFRKQKNTKCVGFSRREPLKKHRNVTYLLSDLLDKNKVVEKIEIINLSMYDEVLFIHPIGMFRFELTGNPKKDYNRDGVDDEIFASNVLTFTNVFNPLKNKIKKLNKSGSKIKLTVCAFGSISDKYNIPFWSSYTKSKETLRKLIKKSISLNKNVDVKGVFVNVSTADTGNERKLRPFGDKTYWLTTKEIVASSTETILKGKKSWLEINVFKHNPNFNLTWYTNHDNVLERWKKQMGLER
jgi:hypothetical protein